MDLKKRIVSMVVVLSLAFMMLIGASATEPEPPQSSKTVLEYDFSAMDALPQLECSTAQKGVAYSAAELADGCLVISNPQTKHCFVRLASYENAMKEGSDYVITLKASMDASESAAADNKDEHRIGIMFGLNALDSLNTVRYFFLRESGKYQAGSYIAGTWTGKEVVNDGVVSQDVSIEQNVEYTFRVYVKSDDTVEVGIYDAAGTLLNPNAEGTVPVTGNLRMGDGIGLYIRGCTLKASYFSIVENQSGAEETDSGETDSKEAEGDVTTAGASEESTQNRTNAAPEIPNAAPTEPATKTSEETPNTTPEEGCSSSLSMASVMLISLAGVMLFPKKKKD